MAAWLSRRDREFDRWVCTRQGSGRSLLLTIGSWPRSAPRVVAPPHDPFDRRGPLYHSSQALRWTRASGSGRSRCVGADQWLKMNSFELISDQMTSSMAARRFSLPAT